MALKKKIQTKAWYAMILGAAVGLTSSFIQTIERIAYAENKAVPLQCDINAIFSCSNVFDAWQSSVFGFSNSILCIVFFAIILGAAFAGATGSALHKNLRLTLHFFSLFFLLFGAWYLSQSVFTIGFMCIFCIFCYGGVILINWAWLRINADDLPLKKEARTTLKRFIANDFDTIAWIAWALLFVFMMIIRFA